MSFIAAAIIGAAGIGGALISSHASHQASQAATQAADTNNALQRDIYNRNTTNLNPYLERGNAAGVAQNALLGLSGDPAAYQNALNNYTNSSGLQFQLQQGNRAVTSNAASRGLLNSGSTLKALQDRGQQTGASYFGQYMNALSGVNNLGMSAGSAIAGVGQGYANAVGQNNQNAADARGNAALSSAGNFNALLGQGANALGTLYGSGSSYGGGSPTGYGGGSITNWAQSLPNQSRIPGIGGF